ncbi:MAG: hypothetical protein ACRD0K_10840 [Egibacteraceae bacterium]
MTRGAGDVRVTDRRLILTVPCCDGQVVALPRAGLDVGPLVDHQIVCRACQRRWTVRFLAERRYGLRACWTQQQTAPGP